MPTVSVRGLRSDEGRKNSAGAVVVVARTTTEVIAENV